MPHARTQIVDALKTALTGLSITGTNVYKALSEPSEDANLPNINIIPGDSSIDEESAAMGDIDPIIFVIDIEVNVKRTTATDNVTQLDSILSEVEAAIHSNSALNTLVSKINLISIEPEYELELENDTANGAISFDFLYRVNRTDPDTIVT